TKAYVDSSVTGINTDITTLESKTVPVDGAMMMRDPALDAWYDDLLDNSNQIDLVVIGDSIAEFGWPGFLQNQLASRYNGHGTTQVSPTNDYVVAYSGAFRAMNGTIQGTPSLTGFGGYSTLLTNGQNVSGTYTCDGVIVVWSEGTGTLTVK